MSEAKFAPGPWRACGTYGQTSNEPGCVYSASVPHEPLGNMVASMTGYFGFDGQVAHAHLIAAAPDMYSALSDFIEYERLMETGDDVAAMLKYADLKEKATKALAKARGEA